MLKGRQVEERKKTKNKTKIEYKKKKKKERKKEERKKEEKSEQSKGVFKRKRREACDVCGSVCSVPVTPWTP